MPSLHNFLFFKNNIETQGKVLLQKEQLELLFSWMFHCITFKYRFRINSTVSVADDHSRVALKPLHGEAESDYINANFIDVSFYKVS